MQLQKEDFMRYIFGMDARDPAACAKALRDCGIEAVVNPPTEAACAATLSSGMAVWGCIGAFSLREDDPPLFLAEDAFGVRRPWFSSGCPNEEALWQRGFLQISRWKDRGATRIFVDGARFASPCPGTEPFTSCFCPRCMRLGTEMGFAMEDMRAAVAAWSRRPDLPAPSQWLLFRQMSIRRYMDAFSREAQSAQLPSAAFVFPPSLAPLVGQTPYATQHIRVIAPMLYRAYPSKPGIACLNAEYASLLAFYADRGDSAPWASVYRQTGVSVPQDSPQSLWQQGFSPQDVEREAALACAQYPQSVEPILQLEDEQLQETVRAVAATGISTQGFFSYTPQAAPYLWDSSYPSQRKAEQ